jgi:hypothetical protein
MTSRNHETDYIMALEAVARLKEAGVRINVTGYHVMGMAVSVGDSKTFSVSGPPTEISAAVRGIAIGLHLARERRIRTHA